MLALCSATSHHFFSPHHLSSIARQWSIGAQLKRRTFAAHVLLVIQVASWPAMVLLSGILCFPTIPKVRSVFIELSRPFYSTRLRFFLVASRAQDTQKNQA